jgi:hypothetical protein
VGSIAPRPSWSNPSGGATVPGLPGQPSSATTLFGSAAVSDSLPSTPAPPSNSLLWKLGAAVVVVAVLVFGYLHFFSGSAVHLPESISGMDRIDTPQVDQVLDQARTAMSGANVTVDAAVYGLNQQPSMIVLLLTGKGLEGQDSSQFFQAFSSGFTSTGGNVRIDVSPDPEHGSDGIDYTCARIRGSFSGGLCMWDDDAATGFVLTFDQGVRPTADLSSEVRAAVES